MNGSYKELEIRFILSILSIATLFLNFDSNAGACGKIISNKFVPQGDYAITLSKHNEKRLNNPQKNGFSTSEIGGSGFASLNLYPGLHSFRGYAVCMQSYCAKSLNIGGSDADEVNFSIQIEDGKSYKLAAKPVEPRSLLPGKRFEVYVVTDDDTPCDVQSKQALPATQESKMQLVAQL